MSASLKGIDVVRSIFKPDRNVAVIEGSGGVADVSVGTVPTSLLETRVGLLKLQPIDRYNPGNVIGALEGTKELQGAVKASGLHIVEPLRIQLIHQPVPGDRSPHFPAAMRDVTGDRILDLVARIFHGVVFFGVCRAGPTPRSFYLTFLYGLPD
ncbi:MAG TPA: hypothetical protein VJP76_04825 [Candidatus Tumulicola sp.]|nr:hypothetical protein [Candidatus Tumulicola sp.]